MTPPGVTYNEKGAYWAENKPEIEKAVKAATEVDYIIACIGENSYCETPGNLTDLTLSRNQLDLVKALSATGKPVILILNEGRPRLINEIEPMAKAVVDIILPGNYGGDTLANLLSGDENFSGKLPFTYPKEINSLINYNYKVSEEVEKMEGAYDYDAVVSVQWAFGYGLSYTSFSYSNLKVNKANFTADDELIFTVDVKIHSLFKQQFLQYCILNSCLLKLIRPTAVELSSDSCRTNLQQLSDDNSTSIGRINLSKEKDRWLTA